MNVIWYILLFLLIANPSLAHGISFKPIASALERAAESFRLAGTTQNKNVAHVHFLHESKLTVSDVNFLESTSKIIGLNNEV